MQPATEPFQSVVSPLTVTITNTPSSNRDVVDRTVRETLTVLYVIWLETRLKHKVTDNTSGSSGADIQVTHETLGDSLRLGHHAARNRFYLLASLSGTLLLALTSTSSSSGLPNSVGTRLSTLLLTTTRPTVRPTRGSSAGGLRFTVLSYSNSRSCLPVSCGSSPSLLCLGDSLLGLCLISGLSNGLSVLSLLFLFLFLFLFFLRLFLLTFWFLAGRRSLWLCGWLGCLTVTGLLTINILHVTRNRVLNSRSLFFSNPKKFLTPVLNLAGDSLYCVINFLLYTFPKIVKHLETKSPKCTTCEQPLQQTTTTLLITTTQHFVECLLHHPDSVKFASLLVSLFSILPSLYLGSSLLPSLLFFLFRSVELGKKFVVLLGVGRYLFMFLK